MNNKPFVIGLTGGIGSGKSTVSDMFFKLGADIVDADVISKALVSAGSPSLKAIANHFGSEKALLKTGELNRASLRELIFHNPQDKKWLEDLLHPLIRQEIMKQIASSTKPYVILSAPLLLESNHYSFVDRVLVVDCSTELQIERSASRDSQSVDSIKRIISTQMPRSERLAAADDIIKNESDQEYLLMRVKQLHSQYINALEFKEKPYGN